jgi:FdhE protein
LKNLKERVQQLKEKRPGYGEILDFYQEVREEQEKTRATLRIEPIHLKEKWKEILAKEGFSLIQKEDFSLDIEASVALFHTLCQIGKEANPYMVDQVNKIKAAIDNKKIDLKKLLEGGVKQQRIEHIADEFEFDKKVFSFLIQSSTKPSIEAGMEQLRSEADPETWQKGSCPICGSLPYLSVLKDEVGKRLLLCSYCSYEWRIERLACPFCDNREQESLQYFYAEEEEAYRIDLCEKCHQYIKTVDLRKIESENPYLEDLATLHLDILASQKGYKRPVPNPWST